MENRLPVRGESLWTTTVEANPNGSGALPPNPIFHEDPMPDVPTPNIDALVDAFSTPADLNRLTGTWP